MSMRKPIGLGLIIGVLALAFAALPAMASAATPTFDPTGGKFPVGFTSKSGAGELRAKGLPAVKCTADTNKGKFTSGTTGEVEVSFTGCTALGLQCTTTGSAAGTITTGTMVFHLVYLDKAHKIPGILLTPPAGGTFTTFTCGGLITVTVKGNGILGRITAPAFGVTSTSFTLSFKGTGEKQEFQKVEEEGEAIHLTASTGGEFVEAAEETEDVGTLENKETGQLTNT
jgi:hypothetical protein